MNQMMLVLQTNLIPILGFQSTSIGNNNLPTIFFRILAQDGSTNKTYAGLNSALFVLHDNTMDTSNYCLSWA